MSNPTGDVSVSVEAELVTIYCTAINSGSLDSDQKIISLNYLVGARPVSEVTAFWDACDNNKTWPELMTILKLDPADEIQATNSGETINNIESYNLLALPTVMGIKTGNDDFTSDGVGLFNLDLHCEPAKELSKNSLLLVHITIDTGKVSFYTLDEFDPEHGELTVDQLQIGGIVFMLVLYN